MYPAGPKANVFGRGQTYREGVTRIHTGTALPTLGSGSGLKTKASNTIGSSDLKVLLGYAAAAPRFAYL
jgi:hypothetical protein